MVDHRKLMSFSQPLEGFGRVVAIAQVTGEEYLALATETGDRVMLALRVDPGQLVLNHQIDEAWDDEYTHVPVDLREGDLATIAIHIGSDSWTFELRGQEPYVYHFPIAGSPVTYAEGGGEWRRIDVHYGAVV